MLEDEEVEVPVSATKEPPKESTKMDADEATNNSVTENDVNMEDAKSTTDAGIENGATASGEKPVQMETDAKVCNYLTIDCGFSSILIFIMHHRNSLLCSNQLNPCFCVFVCFLFLEAS